MARSNNRGGGNRGGRNNNPAGKNQYSDGGVMDLARERPIAAAAVAAGAAAAGLFLWSKRAQISGQLSNLSDQIGEWTDNLRSGNDFANDDDDTAGLTTADLSGSGNASFGARAGGRTTGSSSGRSRSKATAPTEE